MISKRPTSCSLAGGYGTSAHPRLMPHRAKVSTPATSRPSTAVQKMLGYLWISGLVADSTLPPLVDPNWTFTGRALTEIA